MSLVNVFSKKVYADEQKEATSTEDESGEAEKRIERRKSTRGREAEGEESCKKCWDSKQRLRADRQTDPAR